MPLKLAKFLVQYLSREDDLVVDPFGGWYTTRKVAEELGSRWIGSELVLERVQGAKLRFPNAH